MSKVFGSDNFTLVLVPSAGGKSYSVSIRRRVLYLLAVLLGLNLVLLPAVIVWSSLLARKARHQSTMAHELRRLKKENEDLHALQERVEQLASHQARVLAWAGLAPETNTDQTGTNPAWGGGASPRPEPASPSSPEPGTRRRTGAVPPALEGWCWPVDGWISRGFGGAGGADTTHAAVDIVAPRDTPVLAASQGVVSFASWDDQLGNLVVVDHAGGVSTSYGHNEQILVGVGSRVKMGQPIARVGNTGRSSAPHLHFEIRRGGEPVDPEAFLTAR